MTPDYNKLWDELKKKQDSATSAYYQTQRDAIKASANDQRRSAEISHRQSMKSLPAQIARLGLKGTGAAESSLIQANNAYEELLNSIRQDELTNEQNLYTAAAAATKKSGNTKKDSPTKDAGSVPLTYGLGKDIVQSPLGPELYSVDRDSKGNITKWTPVVDENALVDIYTGTLAAGAASEPLQITGHMLETPADHRPHAGDCWQRVHGSEDRKHLHRCLRNSAER